MPEHYITAGGKRLRCGRTTGTCAAMAAAGAVRLLLTGRAPDLISLNTPRDWMVEAPLLDCVTDGETAACSVEKDGGDDVDATHGLPIRATVRRRAEGGTAILGGPGVGIMIALCAGAWTWTRPLAISRRWPSRWGRRPSTRCPGG